MLQHCCLTLPLLNEEAGTRLGGFEAAPRPSTPTAFLVPPIVNRHQHQHQHQHHHQRQHQHQNHPQHQHQHKHQHYCITTSITLDISGPSGNKELLLNGQFVSTQLGKVRLRLFHLHLNILMTTVMTVIMMIVVIFSPLCLVNLTLVQIMMMMVMVTITTVIMVMVFIWYMMMMIMINIKCWWWGWWWWWCTGVKSLLTGTGFDWVRWCNTCPLLALACHYDISITDTVLQQMKMIKIMITTMMQARAIPGFWTGLSGPSFPQKY